MEILADIRKHPWVLVGFTGFLCLVPLAITSTNGWIRRLGGKNWNQVQKRCVGLDVSDGCESACPSELHTSSR